MQELQEFEQLSNAEEYLDFFDIEYDARLVYVKRFHIMKKFGQMLQKASSETFKDDQEKLAFYKYALISVYKNFENGYSPSAAEVWDTFGKPSACSTCSTSVTCNEEEEVSNGVHACTSQPNISFN